MSSRLLRAWLAVPVVGALFAGPATTWAAAPDKPRETFVVDEALDLAYHHEDKRQVLDVFRPRGVEDRPVVLFVHGGAWMLGDKNFFGLYRSVGRFLARHGVVTVMVNYRLSPAVKHPAHVQDIARAFTWVRKNISKHGGSPDRIILGGHSAGGHLVALLAADTTWLADPALGLGDEDRAAIRGVVPVSGVYRIPGAGELARAAVNLLTFMGSAGTTDAIREANGKAEEFNPFRLVFGDEPEERRAASPLTHVRKGMPPFLVVHAERELPTLAPMAREFCDALQAAGVSARLCQVPDCHHNTILFRMNEPGDPMADALLRFIAEHAAK
jgi:acetyl esterase/lipase